MLAAMKGVTHHTIEKVKYRHERSLLYALYERCTVRARAFFPLL